MNLGLLLLLCVPMLSCAQATESSNPECADLYTVKKNLANAVKSFPGSNYVNCKPNKNCSGLICTGNVAGKSFNGTVQLQGCREPVRMIINMNGKHLDVSNGVLRQVKTRLATIHIKTYLEKKNGVVHVTVKTQFCPLGKICFPYTPILSDQKIRVRCNSSWPTMLPSEYPLPPSTEAKNPECKGLKNTKRQVEHHFGLISKILPGSKTKPKISCKPARNCSELQCSGVANDDHFNATATVDYCSDPVKLRLKIDVPNKKIHIDHRLKDGEKYKIISLPPIYIEVNLKRVRNTIYFTASTPLLGVPIYLVKNMSITVDPSHCPGYHGLTTISPQERWKCKKMKTVAEMVEQKLSSKRKDSSLIVTDCHVVNKCSGLHCRGKQGGKEFSFDSSVNSCTSTSTLDFTLLGKRKFTFKNGMNQLIGKPLLVQMKKTEGVVVMNVSLDGHSVLQNAEIPYDPHDCSASAKSSGLSPGAIGGVVVAVIIFFALLIAIIAWIVRGKRHRVARYNDLAMSDDSDPLFFNSEPAIA